MFCNKYKVVKKSKLELKQEEAAAKAADLRETAATRVGKVADKADAAKVAAAGGVATAAAKFKDSVADKADAAKTAAQDARTTVKDKAADTDRETVVDEILPKVMELLAGAAAAGTTAKVLGGKDADTYQGYTGAQHAVHTGRADGVKEHDSTEMIADLAKVAASFFATKKAASVATDKVKDSDVDLADLGKKASGLFAAKKLSEHVDKDELVKKAAALGLTTKAIKKADKNDLLKKAAAAGLSKKALEKAVKDHQKAAAKQDKKGGKGLIALGLLATAAAVGAVVYQRTAPQDDPWATPLADPYTGPQSSTVPVSTSDEPIVSQHEVGDPLSAVSTEPVILDAKDQEQYAATTPTTATEFDRTDDGAGQHLDHNAGSDKPANEI